MLGAIEVLGKCAEAVTWVVKGCEVLDAGRAMCKTYTDEDLSTSQKITGVAINGIFIVCQVTEAYAYAKSNSSNNFKLSAKVTGGLVDVVRQVNSEGFNMNTLQRVTWRLGDCLGSAEKMQCDIVCNNPKATKVLGTGLSIMALATDETAQKLARQAGKSVLEKVSQYYHIVRQYYAPVPKQDDDQPIDDDQLMEEEDVIVAELIAEEEVNPLNDRNWLVDQRNIAVQLPTCSLIPPQYHFDDILKAQTCPITKRPIRFVLMPKNIPDDAPLVYYEKEALLKWIADSKDVAPPGWPNSLPAPINAHSLEGCRSIQNLIDTRLKVLANDMIIEIDNE